MRIITALLASMAVLSNWGCVRKPKIMPKDYNKYHQQAKAFVAENGYQDAFYFLIDMRIHSGQNRFFVYDFIHQKNSYEKLVTHGSCDVLEPNTDAHATPKFSNTNNSHCSSLGKYKVYKRDVSGWGIKIKYWLKGLEPTNNNAEQRVVVLHSWELVPDTEIYPEHLPLSWGCPAVSNDFLYTLDNLMQNQNKPTLLWIINPEEI